MSESNESGSKETMQGCCIGMIEKMKDCCKSEDGTFNCAEMMQKFFKTDEKDK